VFVEQTMSEEFHGLSEELVRQHSTDPCDDCVSSEEANHRIANHLSLLGGFVRLKAADFASRPGAVSRDAVLVLLQGIGAQIDIIARLHRSFATKGQAATHDLGEHLHQILVAFQSGFSGIKVTEEFQPGCIVQGEQILPLSQIVSEVVTNAIKHAAVDGVIRVGCYKDAHGAVLIEVTDNGPGLPKNFNPGTDGGLGFRLLRALSKQLGTIPEFVSNRHGLSFRLTLPIR
jgi:two-component sensor histidine kinase